jgi:hypothetical protein
MSGMAGSGAALARRRGAGVVLRVLAGPPAVVAAREGRRGGAVRLAMVFAPLLDLMPVIRLA